jgi:hypothetical protein
MVLRSELKVCFAVECGGEKIVIGERLPVDQPPGRHMMPA